MVEADGTTEKDSPEEPTVAHYHSFPRRWKDTSESNERGVEILRSITKLGFLLTPERVDWPGERRVGGKYGEPTSSFHKRACFTYLAPQELHRHAREFGAFAIEFAGWNLRKLGAIPVAYVPVSQEHVGFLGMGLAIANRMADFQALLMRVKLFLDTANTWTDPLAEVGFIKKGDGGLSILPEHGGNTEITLQRVLFEKIRKDKPEFDFDKRITERAALGGNVACVQTILNMLTWGIQSYEEQLAAIRALTGFFCKTERRGEEDSLTYYQQREWRILSGMKREGIVGTQSLDTEERKHDLLNIDRDFFSKPIALPNGKASRVVDECAFLKAVDDKHILEYANRVICPESAAPSVRDILKEAGFDNLTVTSLESLGSVG